MKLPLLCSLLAIIFTASFAPAAQDLHGKDLTNRDLRAEDLADANLEEANLTGANLKEVIATGANFKNAKLNRASLDGGDYTRADFRRADFESAGVQNAKFIQANFEGLDLKNLSLQGADLRKANLKNTKGFIDITRADFRQADLRGAYLLGAKDYAGDSANFKDAKYSKKTRFPKGLDPQAAGAILTEDDPAPTPGNAPAPGNNPPAPAKDAPTPGNAPAPANPPVDQKPVQIQGDKDAGAPGVDDIKAALEPFWSMERVKNTFAYKTIQYAAPRPGDFLTDGTPANTKVTVYPIKIQADHTIEFNDGSSRTEPKSAQTVFFKDEFGNWTWRFKG